jgi:hypothetical protein
MSSAALPSKTSVRPCMARMIAGCSLKLGGASCLYCSKRNAKFTGGNESPFSSSIEQNQVNERYPARAA